MSKINELRAQRAKTWEQTKAFLDSHRSDKGVLSAEDTATYEKMEQEIVDLGREIERQERLDAFERELNTPVNTPITQKPDTAKVDTKTGRASDTYKKAFWAQARTKGGMLTAEIRNALQEGVDAAYKAVMKPAEGTILTVMRGTADTAEAESELYQGDPEAFFERLVNSAEEVLQQTEQQVKTLFK